MGTLTSLNDFLKDNMGLAMLVATILILLKDVVVDFLSRESAALASDGDPKNDRLGRLFATLAAVLSKFKLPFSSKKE